MQDTTGRSSTFDQEVAADAARLKKMQQNQKRASPHWLKKMEEELFLVDDFSDDPDADAWHGQEWEPECPPPDVEGEDEPSLRKAVLKSHEATSMPSSMALLSVRDVSFEGARASNEFGITSVTKHDKDVSALNMSGTALYAKDVSIEDPMALN